MNDADVEPDRGPQRLVVGLEDDPLACPGTRLSSSSSAIRRTGTYFHWLASGVGAVQRPRPPEDRAVDREGAQAVEAERVELAVVGVVEVGDQVGSQDRRFGSRGRFPDAPVGIDTRDHAGDRAARADVAQGVVGERVGDRQPGEVDARGRARRGQWAAGSGQQLIIADALWTFCGMSTSRYARFD